MNGYRRLHPFLTLSNKEPLNMMPPDFKEHYKHSQEESLPEDVNTAARRQPGHSKANKLPESKPLKHFKHFEMVNRWA